MTTDSTDLERPDDLLRAEPGSVAEALDVTARLSALAGWVDDRKRAVRTWAETLAVARQAEDGAAPTWRLDLGSVSLTDPQPTPTIVDAEAFARWYLATIEDADPDLHDDAYDVFEFETALGRIVRRRTATVAPEPLLAFLNALAAPADDCDVAYAAAHHLAGDIRVDVEWLLPKDALGTALSPIDVDAHDPLRTDGGSGRPRIALAGETVIDRTTGEEVPGTTVQPAGKQSVQFRPTPEAKDRLRAELERLLGPPALTE